MYNAARVKSWLSNYFSESESIIVCTYSAGGYGCYYKCTYLFIYIVLPPPCVYEHTDVMDLWTCICTCGCEHTYVCTSLCACLYPLYVCVCVTPVCIDVFHSVSIFVPRLHVCVHIYVYVGAYISPYAFSQQEKTHICRSVCVYAGVWHMHEHRLDMLFSVVSHPSRQLPKISLFLPIPASWSCHFPRLWIFFRNWGLCPVLLGEQKAVSAI